MLAETLKLLALCGIVWFTLRHAVDLRAAGISARRGREWRRTLSHAK